MKDIGASALSQIMLYRTTLQMTQKQFEYTFDELEKTRIGEIIIDAHCRTNIPGVYAAGDVSSVPYKQIIIAMGEGAKAALTAFDDRTRGVI
jgi:alkyl hydroperoxide reductase subunit AhpF